MEERKQLKRPRGTCRLIPGKCIACGARCQSVCPKDAITMKDAPLENTRAGVAMSEM